MREPPPVRLEQTISATEDGDAVQMLATATGLSKSRIKDAMRKGAVWLGKGKRMRRLRRATARIHRGDALTINYDEAILALEVPVPTLLADENSWSVWYKPAGVMSSGSRFGDHTAIDRLVERQLDRPTFLVHRLDQYASGLILLAHDKQAAAQLSRQFRDREVAKTYRAVVEGIVESAVTVNAPLDDREAISHVEPVHAGRNCTLVEVSIETGRKHQIRRHLAQLGHPVWGDRQYGTRQESSLLLTACELGFTDPRSGDQKYFVLPDDLQPQIPD